MIEHFSALIYDKPFWKRSYRLNFSSCSVFNRLGLQILQFGLRFSFLWVVFCLPCFFFLCRLFIILFEVYFLKIITTSDVYKYRENRASFQRPTWHECWRLVTSRQFEKRPAVSLWWYRDSILLCYGNLVNMNNSENCRQQSLDTPDNLYRENDFITALLRWYFNPSVGLK